MGIRVNRALGWALTDVRFTNGTIDDPRINRGSPVLSPVGRGRTLEQFRAFLADKHQDDPSEQQFVLHSLDRLPGSAPYDSVIVHAQDEDTTGVVLVRPVHMPQWHRRDDDLDYVDASSREDGPVPIIQTLAFNPFPYGGSRMDATNGQPLAGRVADEFRFMTNLPGTDEAKATFAREHFDTDDWVSVERRVVPDVPRDVRHLLEWSGLLTSEQPIGDMRPTLLTYWN